MPCSSPRTHFRAIHYISAKLNDPSAVSLRIYSQQGQLIATLIDEQMGAGIHQIDLEWPKLIPAKLLPRACIRLFCKLHRERLAKVADQAALTRLD